VAVQLQVILTPLASGASVAVRSVRRLPWVWLERAALRDGSERGSLFSRRRARHRAQRRARRRLAQCGRAGPPWGGASGVGLPKAPEIIVTTPDFERLQRLVACTNSSAAERLDAELARARVVAESEVPVDVVTMNSNVIYEDGASGQQHAVRVVYPKDAEEGRGWVSVLAPIGAALLGSRKGQEIEWPTSRGTRRLRVVAVPDQPECDGHFAL
jgi:regulator of nucleoside diphosphate kinase